jgi:4,5-dihydroxyphthalate decarboxylase
MSSTTPQRFTAAIGERWENLHLLRGKVKLRGGVEIQYPDVPRNASTGAPMPLYSPLAREHPWDLGEQAFSTYLMSREAGAPSIALPVFMSRFFPHTGLWVTRASGITQVEELVGRRIACSSFGTNYSVWARGALTHQYDLPIQRMIWVESVEEHIPTFRPPKRFQTEQIGGGKESALVLNEGVTEAATLPGPGLRTDLNVVRRLFEDPYPEIASYAEANGFMPINTLITMRLETVQKNPELPRLVFDAYAEARGLYEADIAAGNEDDHMGVSLRRLRETTGLQLPAHGFQQNRRAIQTMISYAYEQGIIKKLVDPEEIFLLTDS